MTRRADPRTPLRPDDAPMFPMRTVVLGAFVPSLVFDIGTGAMLPIIVPTAVGLGADLATAAVVAALLPIGQILADLPAGSLAAKVGTGPRRSSPARSPRWRSSAPRSRPVC